MRCVTTVVLGSSLRTKKTEVIFVESEGCANNLLFTKAALEEKEFFES